MGTRIRKFNLGQEPGRLDTSSRIEGEVGSAWEQLDLKSKGLLFLRAICMFRQIPFEHNDHVFDNKTRMSLVSEAAHEAGRVDVGCRGLFSVSQPKG